MTTITTILGMTAAILFCIAIVLGFALICFLLLKAIKKVLEQE